MLKETVRLTGKALWSVPLVLVASIACAAPPEEAAQAVDGVLTGEAHTGGGGLPQFDPTWFASQFFWLAIAFVLLYFVFGKSTLPKISAIIEDRKNIIESDLKEAERLTEEADQVHDQYKESLHAARAAAAATTAGMESELKARSEQSQTEFQHYAEEQLQATQARINEEKNAAMSEITSALSNLTAEAAGKIAGVSVASNEAEAVLKDISNRSTNTPSNKAEAA